MIQLKTNKQTNKKKNKKLTERTSHVLIDRTGLRSWKKSRMKLDFQNWPKDKPKSDSFTDHTI